MKKLCRISLLLITLIAIVVGKQANASDSTSLREPTAADISSWRRPWSAKLTPDGNWFVYLLRPATAWKPGSDGEVTAVVRSTRDNTERRYPLGSIASGAGNLKMSPSGRWVAFQVAQRVEKSDRSRDSQQPAHTGLILVEVPTGKAREFPAVQNFSFAKGRNEYILLDSYPTNASEPWRDITVKDLGTERDLVQDKVAEYSFDKVGSWFAWTNREGLNVCDLASGSKRFLEADNTGSFQTLTWSERGNALAALRADPRAGRVIVVFRNLSSIQPNKVVLAPQNLRGFPAGYEISSEVGPRGNFGLPSIPALTWREDENGLFFGITAVQAAVKVDADKAPSLVLWHWKDQRLPTEKKHESARRITDLCFVSLNDHTFLRLGDGRLFVQLHLKGRYLLAIDKSSYAWQDVPYTVRASSPRDYYLVDLRTGGRRLIVKNLRVVPSPWLSAPPQLSPDGTVFVYQNNQGDYVAYQVRDGKERNLTVGLPTKFYYIENDPKTRRQPKIQKGGGPVLQGWTNDGAYVVISDYYDIWALPLRGGSALNLTGNGRHEGITYKLFTDLSGRNFGKASQDGESIYFTFHEPRKGTNGLARRVLGRTNIEVLHSKLADTICIKASEAQIYVCQLWSSVESGNYYLLGSNWQITTRLTDANPHERELIWAPEAKYLTYTTAHGDRLTAGLYLPVGYIPGKTYPMILPDVYETAGSAFVARYPGHFVDRLQRKGYAVLRFDIQPRFNEAGQAAVEGATAAVEAAVATGVVDRSRIGLIGHSHGGYEVHYLISHTNLFKAAVAKAGIANIISYYGSVRSDSGVSSSSLVEYDQPFISEPWWENWDAYVRNSPLFSARNINTPLLIIHGDQDDAVPFNQAVEMFNTLRRMGNKPVVLLQYAGEDHVLSKEETKRDMDIRIEQFFDHYLKGESAPPWWSDGISYYQGQAPVPDPKPAAPKP